MDVELGLIEGYYGKPWTWAERREQAAFLAAHGYRFYMYAPKADPFLRRRWAEDHPPEEAEAIAGFAAHCRGLGVRFGVGLSPFEIYRDFGGEAKAALARKLAALDALGVQDLGILFDDMRGDLPDLAATQAGIVHWIAERTAATRLVVCPTYYSDAPELDRFFGRRPTNYLEDFGAALDPAIQVFWTGEEVCSPEFSPGHLARVSSQLGRKPFLWDNYPVNDGPRMCRSLHIRGFTGRPAAIGAHIAAHAVNPALQPTLTRIPALTLAESYRLGPDYQYGQAMLRAAEQVCGPELGARLHGHVGVLQDSGLDRLDEARPRLRDIYRAFDHPAAREVLAWLDGAYAVTAAEMAES